MSRNGEKERDLYSFLAELSEELNEAVDERGIHSTDSREALSGLSENLQKSLNSVVQTAGMIPNSWQQEAWREVAQGDLKKGVTLRHCVVELEKFLREYPDLDVDLENRIRNKLQEIKNPEAAV